MGARGSIGLLARSAACPRKKMLAIGVFWVQCCKYAMHTRFMGTYATIA